MTALNYVDSVKVYCSRVNAPSGTSPLTLTLRGNSKYAFIDIRTQENEQAYILSKLVKYKAFFDEHFFQSKYSGIQVKRDGINYDISEAKYSKEENCLSFNFSEVPLPMGGKHKNSFKLNTQIEILVKDGINDLIKLDGKYVLVSYAKAIEGAIKKSSLHMEQRLSTSKETSPQTAPQSPSLTSPDERDIPYVSSVDVIWSKKDSTEKVKSTLRGNKSNKALLHDKNSETTIISHLFKYRLATPETVFKTVSNVFMQYREKLIYLPICSFENNELIINFEKATISSRQLKKSKSTDEKIKQAGLTLYIKGKNPQDEGVFLRAEGNFYITNKLNNPATSNYPSFDDILHSNDKSVKFTEAWPELVPSETLPEIPVGLSLPRVSEGNATTTLAINVDASFDKAKRSLEAASEAFKNNGQERAASIVSSFREALTSAPLNTVNDRVTAMGLLAQMSKAFAIVNLPEAATIIADTEGSSTNIKPGKEEVRDDENPDPRPIKIRKKNEDAFVHSAQAINQ